MLQMSFRLLTLLTVVCMALPWIAAAAEPPFAAFESGPVRPIAMSPDGRRLFVANTPNNTLDVFDIGPQGVVLRTRVPVGMEPVAVAARGNDEVWTVNHLSDSVSIVTLRGVPHVARTLLVGDEPRDIVFAGNPQRAFITTAHRGQHRMDESIRDVPGAGDPGLTTPGVGRADVWVFDPLKLGTSGSGSPVRILNFFADTPRSLARSPDGERVYVAAFKSGNRTTSVLEQIVCDGFQPQQPCRADNGDLIPGGNPGPATNVEARRAPETGLIVKFNPVTGRWEDELQRDWNKAVRFNLPDLDVFVVDARTLQQTIAFTGVGTTLFNMAVNPRNGNVYVSNTEAFNERRFEGPGTFGGSTVQGRIAATRITVLSGSAVMPRHLNKHLDYDVLASDASYDPTAGTHSLSTPLDMAITADGRTLFVAAFGSSKIGRFDTQALETDRFDPKTLSSQYIAVSGGGPSGLVLDEARGRMYVTTRFDHAIKIIDLKANREMASVPLRNPEPASVIAGRSMLYDATRFSGNGEASCASCHIFGDMDDLAWDLGNPDEAVTQNPLAKNLTSEVELRIGKRIVGLSSPVNGSDDPGEFHPMKGPMTTQTLRGLASSGAMHWRGDRATGFFGSDPLDAQLSFNNFIVAFQGLLGSPETPSASQMQQFTDFQLQVMLPPNPVRALDNSLTPAQQRGRDFYVGTRPSDGLLPPNRDGGVAHQTAFNCEGCHRLDPAQGLFGTGGSASFEGLTQIVKIPHLRNLYQKVGMFGAPGVHAFGAPDSGFMGDQVRGFGFIHDGSVDTLFRFFTLRVFDPRPQTGFPLINPDATRKNMVEFMLAFDSDLAPIVGQQITLTVANRAAAESRLMLLQQRARTAFESKMLGGTTKECELVAHLATAHSVQGYWYDATADVFVASDGVSVTAEQLRRRVSPHREITYTCTPPGSGKRMAYRF